MPLWLIIVEGYQRKLLRWTCNYKDNIICKIFQNKNYINNESYFSCFKSLEILKRSLFCSRNGKIIFVGQAAQFIVDILLFIYIVWNKVDVTFSNVNNYLVSIINFRCLLLFVIDILLINILTKYLYLHVKQYTHGMMADKKAHLSTCQIIWKQIAYNIN